MSKKITWVTICANQTLDPQLTFYFSAKALENGVKYKQLCTKNALFPFCFLKAISETCIHDFSILWHSESTLLYCSSYQTQKEFYSAFVTAAWD